MKDYSEQIISKLKELNQKLDGILKGGRENGKKLPDSPLP